MIQPTLRNDIDGLTDIAKIRPGGLAWSSPESGLIIHILKQTNTAEPAERDTTSLVCSLI